MKKQLILPLVLLVTLFSFAQKKELKKLEKAVKNNNFAEAKAMVSQLESMEVSMDDKMKAKYYFISAKAFYANGNGESADLQKALDNFKKVNGKLVSDYKQTIQFVQNDLLSKANAAYTSKNFKEASKLFEILYVLNPKDEVYLYYAASSAISGQNYDIALKHYLKLNELDYTGVETEYFATNIVSGKEEILSKSVRDIYVKTKSHIKPGERLTKSKKAEITKNIALIYINNGKTDEALAAIKEAREADPNDSSLIITEANTQFKLGNTSEYERLIKEAIATDPSNKELLYTLGVLSAEAGNNADAKKYYGKALEIDPDYTNALTNMAVLVLVDEKSIIGEMNGLGSSAKDNKRYDELKQQRIDLYKSAIPYLERVLSLDDKNIDAAKTLVSIYVAIDQGVKAKALKTKFGL